MESETPPPPPTTEEVRKLVHPPRPLPLPFEVSTEPPAYLSVHTANSGRLHNTLIRRLSLHIQATLARTVLGLPFGNTLQLFHQHRLLSAVRDRPANQSLVTVSNHQSTLDDPVLMASLLPYSWHTDPNLARWGWCARELCFPTPFISWFFRHGKIFPIVRGLGLHQEGMREAAEHIADGQWMHVYPEGKCIPLARGIGPLRWGTAKLVADAYRRAERCRRTREAWAQSESALASAATSSATAGSSTPAPAAPAPAPAPASTRPCPLPPLLLPMVHHGMPKVQPFYQPLPNRGHLVRAIIGEPLEVGDLIELHARNEHNRIAFDYPLEEDLYAQITERIAGSLQELDQQLADIETSQGDPPPATAPHRAWYDFSAERSCSASLCSSRHWLLPSRPSPRPRPPIQPTSRALESGMGESSSIASGSASRLSQSPRACAAAVASACCGPGAGPASSPSSASIRSFQCSRRKRKPLNMLQAEVSMMQAPGTMSRAASSGSERPSAAAAATAFRHLPAAPAPPPSPTLAAPAFPILSCALKKQRTQSDHVSCDTRAPAHPLFPAGTSCSRRGSMHSPRIASSRAAETSLARHSKRKGAPEGEDERKEQEVGVAAESDGVRVASARLLSGHSWVSEAYGKRARVQGNVHDGIDDGSSGSGPSHAATQAVSIASGAQCELLPAAASQSSSGSMQVAPASSVGSHPSAYAPASMDSEDTDVSMLSLLSLTSGAPARWCSSHGGPLSSSASSPASDSVRSSPTFASHSGDSPTPDLPIVDVRTGGAACSSTAAVCVEGLLGPVHASSDEAKELHPCPHAACKTATRKLQLRNEQLRQALVAEHALRVKAERQLLELHQTGDSSSDPASPHLSPTLSLRPHPGRLLSTSYFEAVSPLSMGREVGAFATGSAYDDSAGVGPSYSHTHFDWRTHAPAQQHIPYAFPHGLPNHIEAVRAHMWPTHEAQSSWYQ